MLSYFITPIPPENWEAYDGNFEIDFAALVENVMLKWPNILLPHRKSVKAFSMPSSDPNNYGGGAEINLIEDPIPVIRVTPFEGWIEFTIWFRSYVDENVPLFLSKELHLDYLELKSNTSINDVIEFMRS